MAKARRSATRRRQPTSVDIENTRWLVPITFVVIFLAMIVLFSDFIFSDQMLHGSDTLTAGYAFRNYYVEHFTETGSVPMWTPFAFGGMPYVDAFHGDIFYPGTFLKFLMPLKRALGWQLFWHIFLSAITMYFAAREYKLSRIPSLIAAAAYGFAGYLVSLVHPGHDGKIFVTALYPLMMLFLHRGFERRSFVAFSLLGLVIGVIILSPHPQMSYFALWSLAAYSAFKLINLWRDTKDFTKLIYPSALVTYAVVIGLLFSAIQFWPGVYYTSNYSPRSEEKQGWDWATSWSIHEEEAMGLLVPEFAGVSTRKAETYYWGKNQFKDNAETVGAVCFMLALLGFLFVRRRSSYFWGGWGLFTLVYALGATTPLFYIFYSLIPQVKSMRSPSMIMFMFAFAAALLAGMFIQKVIESVREKKSLGKNFDYFLWGVPGLLLLMALLFTANGKGMLDLWSSIFYSSASTTPISETMTKLDLAYLNLPAIVQGSWIAFVFTSLAAGAIWIYRKGKAGVPILLGVVAILVVDGVRFDSRFIDTVDEQEYNRRFGKNQIAELLKSDADRTRFINLFNVQENRMPYYEQDVVVGYHGNQLRWYEELLGGLSMRNVGGKALYFPQSIKPRLLNLVGAKYFIAPKELPMAGYDFGVPPSPTYDLGQAYMYVNSNAMPRVYLCDSVRVIEDRERLVDEILNGTTDMRHVALLGEPIDEMIQRADSTSRDTAWITDYQPNEVTVRISSNGPRMLIMSENYYFAWEATVDGEPANLYMAQGAFRGVPVPAGYHEVQFVYNSSLYNTSKIVTWLTILYLAGVFGFAFYKRKKDAVEEQVEDVSEDEAEEQS